MALNRNMRSSKYSELSFLEIKIFLSNIIQKNIDYWRTTLRTGLLEETTWLLQLVYFYVNSLREIWKVYCFHFGGM